MSEITHTRGPWFNREGEIIADTREQTCCGQPVVGAEYMGQQEMVCCGCPDVDGFEEDVIARVSYERDIPLVLAAPDLLEALKEARLLGLASVIVDKVDAAIAKAEGRS